MHKTSTAGLALVVRPVRAMARQFVDDVSDITGDVVFKYNGVVREVSGAVPAINRHGDPYITAHEDNRGDEYTDVPRRYSVRKMRKPPKRKK